MQLYFVCTLALCLFDWLAEGIAALFVFGHVSGRLAMIKSSGSRFQFCVNAAINPWFLVRKGFNTHSGQDISYALANKLTHRVSVYINVIVLRLSGTYPSPRDQSNLEARNPIGQTSVV